MKNCALCSEELKFMNTPTFGAGKLGDGGIVCMSCFKKISKAKPGIALKLNKHSLSEIHLFLQERENLIQEHETAKDQTNIGFNQKRENYLRERETLKEQANTRLDEIKAQIQLLNLSNISSFFGRKEINELPKILALNENIDNIIQGTYNNGQGILVSTNRRLIFIDKGLLYGLKVEDFPLDKITSLLYETGLIQGKVKIHTSGNIAVIDHVEKSAARKFAEFVRDKLSQPKEQPIQTSTQPSVLDQLEKLGKLRESGILSEEEFTEQKKKLLQKL